MTAGKSLYFNICLSYQHSTLPRTNPIVWIVEYVTVAEGDMCPTSIYAMHRRFNLCRLHSLQHDKEETNVNCHQYRSAETPQENAETKLKTPMEFRSRANWAKLSSKAITLDNSKMNSDSFNQKLVKPTANILEATKQLHRANKSSTVRATNCKGSTKPSSLLWQQAVS